jgi:hypothetical protein
VPKRLHIAVLILAFILGIGAAALGVDERKATLAIVTAYGVLYGAVHMFRRYRRRGGPRHSV